MSIEIKETHSSSEVDKVNRCLKAHYWAYGEGIEKIEKNKPLQVGLAFHEMAEVFYNKLKLYHETRLTGDCSIDYEDCVEAASVDHFLKMMDEGKYRDENILTAKETFIRYVDNIDPWEWEIIAVEDYLEYKLSDDVSINGVIDIVARLKKVPDKKKYGHLIGKLAIIDHKTTYNFYSLWEYKLNAQLPKYQFAANRLMKYGERVECVILNQVRTRADARDKYTRTVLESSEKRQANIVNEHLKTAEEALRLKKLPLPEWREKARMCLQKDICRYCDNTALCDLELDGAPESQIRSHIMGAFKKRDTSYRESRNANAS